MRSLDDTATAKIRAFFTVCRSGQPFTGTPMDMTIEQTVNRSCKAAGGVSKVTLNEGILIILAISYPALYFNNELSTHFQVCD